MAGAEREISEAARPSVRRGDVRAAIRDQALAIGFDSIGFTRASLAAEARADLAGYLAEGYHGDMGWLAAHADRRGDPTVLWPEARSVVVLGMNYAPETDPLEATRCREKGSISVYARGRDYHDLVKSRLKALARWIAAQWPGDLKVFVDTAPVMEKPLAEAAGIGWQGKHTNLVSRNFGSWLFLGEIFLSIELPEDEGEADHCGACRRCLDACPTGAFPAPHRIDARRCISYLTIEHKGVIDLALRPLIGNRIYGCDDCLAVCPWNKFAKDCAEPGLKGRPMAAPEDLAELARLEDAEFRQVFAGSPIKRIGRDRFLRNVLIAIGNSGLEELLPAALARLADPSPLVRGAAVWAVRRLAGRERLAELASRHLAGEVEESVREEWREALKNPKRI